MPPRPREPLELEPPRATSAASVVWPAVVQAAADGCTRLSTVAVLLFVVYLLAQPASLVATDDDAVLEPAKTREFRCAVLDGGSGKAAVSTYACSLGADGCRPGSVKALGQGRFKADAAAVAASGAFEAFFLHVENALDGPGPLAIGLTGGVRKAMAAGALDAAKIDAFFAAAKQRWPQPVARVLEGADEAAYELAAGRFVAAASLGVGDVATLSAGGASSQLAAGGAYASLSTDLYGIEARAADVGDERALAEWYEALDAELARVPPGLSRKLARAELVLGIAMHASAAAAAGVGERVVGAREALEALEGVLDAARRPGAAWRALGVPNPYGLDDDVLRRGTLFSAARASRIVGRALPPDARLYFARSVGGLPCDWALGMFLDTARREARKM